MPKNKKQMQRYLGLLNCCARYNFDLAEYIKPLYESTEEKTKFQVTPQLVEIFKKSKQSFIKNIILKHPQPTRDYNLYTDASNLAM